MDCVNQAGMTFRRRFRRALEVDQPDQSSLCCSAPRTDKGLRMKGSNRPCGSSCCAAEPAKSLERSTRAVAAALGGAVMMVAFGSARADVPISGVFTATQVCPAFQSFRKSSNPGDVAVEPNKTYRVIAKNKPDATHYRERSGAGRTMGQFVVRARRRRWSAAARSTSLLC